MVLVGGYVHEDSFLILQNRHGGRWYVIYQCWVEVVVSGGELLRAGAVKMNAPGIMIIVHGLAMFLGAHHPRSSRVLFEKVWGVFQQEENASCISV